MSVEDRNLIEDSLSAWGSLGGSAALVRIHNPAAKLDYAESEIVALRISLRLSNKATIRQSEPRSEGAIHE